MPYKALNGLVKPSRAYKAAKGLIRPLRALQGPEGPYEGLKGLIRPKGESPSALYLSLVLWPSLLVLPALPGTLCNLFALRTAKDRIQGQSQVNRGSLPYYIVIVFGPGFQPQDNSPTEFQGA